MDKATATPTDWSNAIYNFAATIASGGATSGAIDLGGRVLCGIFLPSTFTGSVLTFTGAATLGGTYKTVQSAGSDYSINVAGGKYVAVDPQVFSGIQYLKIVSGSTEGADRALTIASRTM